MNDFNSTEPTLNARQVISNAYGLPTPEQIFAANKLRQEMRQRELDMIKTMQLLSSLFAISFGLCVFYLLHF